MSKAAKSLHLFSYKKLGLSHCDSSGPSSGVLLVWAFSFITQKPCNKCSPIPALFLLYPFPISAHVLCPAWRLCGARLGAAPVCPWPSAAASPSQLSCADTSGRGFLGDPKTLPNPLKLDPPVRPGWMGKACSGLSVPAPEMFPSLRQRMCCAPFPAIWRVEVGPRRPHGLTPACEDLVCMG